MILRNAVNSLRNAVGIICVEGDVMENALKTVSELMLLSAKTAPKAVGNDLLEYKVASEKEKKRIADGMESRESSGWKRDAQNIRDASKLVLIGVKELGKDELLRGEVDVSTMDPDLKGKVSPMRLIDLGIALGSAAKTASLHNADNRVMWRAGVIASKLKILDAPLVVAIPIAGTGKSIFFDR